MAEPTPAGSTRTTAEFHVADDEGRVAVRKLVSKGERLELDSGATSIKLDALLLEGLTWQRDRGALADLLDDAPGLATDPVPLEPTDDAGNATDSVPPSDDGTSISISNEYSTVWVRKVETGGGEALALSTPGRGTRVTLGAPSLRDVARVDDTDRFSVWFKTPFGPEDTPLEGPL